MWGRLQTQVFDLLLREPDVPPDDEPEDDFHIGRETGEATFCFVRDCIARQQHVLLIGPRGCGKSECARQGIKKAAQAGIVTPGAEINAQGNKEFPRDYFFEPEVSFLAGKDKPQVVMRPAPLFRHALTNKDGTLDIKDPQAEARPVFALPQDNGTTIPIDRFVLFLDEINRFNDGVLDTLLLLLEEGKVLYQGRELSVPVTVVATMNPPGYDASARSLSPPLLARFSVTTRMYTAGLAVLVDEIIRKAMKKWRDKGILNDTMPEPSEKQIWLLAAATLCFWGTPRVSKASIAYLSPATRTFLNTLYKHGDDEFKAAMTHVAENSTYGPDARAAKDWILLAASSAQGEGSISNNLFTETLADAVANKLVPKFNADAKPQQFIDLIKALRTIQQKLFDDRDPQRLLFWVKGHYDETKDKSGSAS